MRKICSFPTFNVLKVLSSTSDKAKLFTDFFSENFHLDEYVISLTTFSSRANLKLPDILVTAKIRCSVYSSGGSEEL